MNTINYQERNVAFIDILGFSNLINKSETNPQILIDVYESLKILKEYKDNITSFNSDELSPQVSVFSDNVVISYINNNKDSEYYLVLDCIVLYLSLLAKGILVRGGITTGALYHDKDIVFGPALVKAYHIESNYSIYPRIVCDDTNYGLIIEGSLYKRDFDGLVYIDPIDNLEAVGNGIKESPYEFLSKIYNVIMGIEFTNNLGVDAKILWLRNYMNRCFIKDEDKIVTLNQPRYLITPDKVSRYFDESDKI
ncbi:hypothetical protein [Paenibacillus woosongensis]|uniref:Guanylate cyclase domain-containing protein n=1 Tax=Paenibacillus woosongensis TaxID=307580 RepID=A0ABQ4MT62_9BACL|nr:hypothetical protein [Paenibacillus woosongensis]GIP59102.1 hypothetical protein J15TS10_29160 [Paenibacillus woosongensis]